MAPKFIFTEGDILNKQVCMVVNPVNSVGIMGKGLALQFKNKYPDMFLDYLNFCVENNNDCIGKLHFYKTFNPEFNNKIIICNFFTKKHWKDKSELNYINLGLDELVNTLNRVKCSSIAIPKIGCGLGGLNWLEVKSMIVNKLMYIDKDVVIYIHE